MGNVAKNTRLNIPPINMNDGPQGFRDNLHPATTTAWPSGLTMAATWDPEAMLAWGDGMGKEFYAKGANVQGGNSVMRSKPVGMVKYSPQGSIREFVYHVVTS